MSVLPNIWLFGAQVFTLKWLRFLFKMSLAVSLRRTMLMLLTATIFILMVFYWNQGGYKPPNYIGMEKTIRSHTETIVNPLPIEKMWTYKCEGDKCVRYLYATLAEKGEKRVPFMTCSMTCGNMNIWPYPTIKAALSSKSLKFVADDVQLQLDSPFAEPKKYFPSVFKLFLKDLKQLQRQEYVENANDDAATGNSAVNAEQRQMNRDAAAFGTGNQASQSLPAMTLLANAFKPHKHCDINSLIVKVSILKSGDMNLNLETDESYQLSTTTEKRHMQVQISANSFFGARHGLSTLQQLIWFDDEDQMLRIVSKALIRDEPKFRYRGVMLDTARHYFSVDAIKRTLVGMSHAKLNRFHWHITDSQSFPYVSSAYPELAAHGAYSDNEVYTADDVREISEFAKLHGIQVITEIDAPAHAGNGWDWGPKRGLGELSLCINQQPWSFYCGEPPCGQLNPKNNNTYLILQHLYEEMLDLTGSTDYFHLGGDEVNLECWAQYFNDTDLRGLWCEFMLNALARLKIANKNVEPKIVAVWSSGLTNTKCLPKNQFTVQLWGGSTWQENYDLIDNGFNVIFSHVDAWYLDCGFGNWRSTGDAACSPYRTWQNVYKHRPWERMRLDKTRIKQVLGGEACLWTEQVDESQLDNRLWPRAAAIGERLWSDPDDSHDFDVLPQDVFKRISVFRNRLVELGFRAEAIFPKYCAQNPGECI